jgi:hypothetical protein
MTVAMPAYLIGTPDDDAETMRLLTKRDQEPK